MKHTNQTDAEKIEEYETRAKEYFVSLQNIEKVYPTGGKVVSNFNLDIKQKEFIVIVGPSGCGKSTTLRMVSGLEDITSGNLFIDHEYSNYKPSRERKMAMVFQSYALYPQKTVFDNIAFPLKINKFSQTEKDYKYIQSKQIIWLLNESNRGKTIKILKDSSSVHESDLKPFEFLLIKLNIDERLAKKLLSFGIQDCRNPEEIPSKCETIANRYLELCKNIESRYSSKGLSINAKGEIFKDNSPIMVEAHLSREEIDKRVFAAAKILDLGTYLDRLPKELSGGQMQRVALGRAIVKNVQLFLMDEPLSNLDAKLRLTMRSEIVKLHNCIGATTIYVTHDQTEAMTMADRVVVMSRGFIQQIDTPERIYSKPNNLFVAKFIGSPSINIFEGEYLKSKIVITDSFSIDVSSEFQVKHDAFYRGKADVFKRVVGDFQSPEKKEEAIEYIRKIDSALFDEKSVAIRKKKRNKLLSSIIKKKKKQNSILPEYEEAINKQAVLKKCLEAKHKIVLGIRPESLTIRKHKDGEKVNGILVQATVCELLGSDYNIHFDLFGSDFIAKTGIKEHYSAGEMLDVSFSEKDVMMFDAVTGDRIQ